ncbi:MAG: biosynthetic arginine decarboxylase, partial [Myxococcota bacterium]
QQRHLVEEVVHFGRPFRYGLEAGSKPELLIALAMMNDPDGFIICNGYKDEIFMETALVGSRFDKEVIVVLERAEELELILRASKKLGIRPSLGVRAKLSSKGMGRWSGSSGDRAKFGLATAELVNLIDELAARDMLDCLKLLHFHIGSQVSSILPIKNAIREAANLYVELAKMGASMGYLDVGGGLAVDYDGSKTDFRGSKNYDLAEYAADVVHGIKEACDKAEVAEPIIVTEAGRAVAAYQSVLVFEAVGADIVRFGAPKEPPEDAHRVLDELYYTWKNIVPKNVQESFHDAMQAREEARSLFRYGYLPLRTLAIAERLFWHCCEKISDNLNRLKYVPEELQQLEETLSAIYYCNFSMFQSAPDVWAIQQLFPIMPIHRLEERPSERATLADLTCDSDGMIKNFIDPEEDKKVLEVHELRKGERYLMAMFLVGAYQEILGDMHNLFGDTNAVHVRLENSGYSVAHVIKGDAIDEVFRYVSYDPEDMVERVRQQAERALNQGRMDLSHVRTFMRHYERTLKSYTYLTAEE